jgi:hypothetical protein
MLLLRTPLQNESSTYFGANTYFPMIKQDNLAHICIAKFDPNYVKLWPILTSFSFLDRKVWRVWKEWGTCIFDSVRQLQAPKVLFGN